MVLAVRRNAQHQDRTRPSHRAPTRLPLGFSDYTEASRDLLAISSRFSAEPIGLRLLPLSPSPRRERFFLNLFLFFIRFS